MLCQLRVRVLDRIRRALLAILVGDLLPHVHSPNLARCLTADEAVPSRHRLMAREILCRRGQPILCLKHLNNDAMTHGKNDLGTPGLLYANLPSVSVRLVQRCFRGTSIDIDHEGAVLELGHLRLIAVDDFPRVHGTKLVTTGTDHGIRQSGVCVNQRGL